MWVEEGEESGVALVRGTNAIPVINADTQPV